MSSDPKQPRTAAEDDSPTPEKGSGKSASDPREDERAERAARAKERASAAERVRRHRERKKAQQETTQPAETTDAEVAECGAVFSLIYDVAIVPIAAGRLAPLQEEQAERAGRVLAPLVKKYAPLLGEYSQEIAAVLVIGSIFRSNWRSQPEGADVDATSIEVVG